MKEKKFDDIMEAWVNHEVEYAPRMKPTGDMYRMVRAKQKKAPVFSLRSRWTVLGAAVASLILVIYVVQFHTSFFQLIQPGQTVAWMGQRKGFDASRGTAVKPVQPPGKGAGKGQVSFGQLVFFIDRQNAPSVQTIDLQAQHREVVSLTTADNYRLLMVPARDWYVYVFQMSTSGSLAKLFPDETFSSFQNPLEQEKTYYLPSEPNWFYLTGNTDMPEGEGRLYVVTSEHPLSALMESFDQYKQAEDESTKQAMLAEWIEVIDNIDSAEVIVLKLTLKHP